MSGASTLWMPEGFDWKNPDYDPVYRERAERLARIRAGDADLAALKAFYADDRPAEFIHDWGMTFDPRNAERSLPTTVPFLLFKRQEDYIRWILRKWRQREDGLVEKSRDMGLSWLCVGFAVWMWLFKEGTVIGFGSRKEEYVDDLNDPKSLFWKARAFIGLLPLEFQPAGWNPKKHAPFMSIVNPENGAAIVGEAGDNIGRGNRTAIYFKDESAFYEHPATIDAALSQTSNCKIDVSTPNGEGNPFAQKRRGGVVDVFTFNWKDDPRKDRAWYDKQLRTLDPVVVAQEVDIDYAASTGNAWIPGTHVTEAQMRGPADVPRTGPWRLGVDVARFGDDKTVIVLRGHRAAPTIASWGKLGTMQVVGIVTDYCRECYRAGIKIEQIAVDVIGIGAGVVDRLLEIEDLENIQIVGVNSALRVDDGANYNLRAKMWRDMKDWLDPRNGPVSVANNRQLTVDLSALRYSYKGNLLLLESKEDAKRRGIKSPDHADALALTFAEPVKPRVTTHTPEAGWEAADAVIGY